LAPITQQTEFFGFNCELSSYAETMTLTPADIDRIAAIRTVDITTIGRSSGRPRRIEIWWFRFDERFIITGTPGRRDWLANLKANPTLVVHVDGRDLAATANEVTDADFRRRFFAGPSATWYATQAQLQRLVVEAPMVEVVFI
jgi:deazaflavin-dependent oxidoreductase (nitroreductase family)